MNPSLVQTSVFLQVLMLATGLLRAQTNSTGALPEIRTPKPSPAPRINGPSIFGVRPGHPFFYRIPATGERPMRFSVDALPSGVTVDAETGQLSGTFNQPGEYVVTFHARNSRGGSEKKFKIVVGETIALTPPLGWNSWNCWGPNVDAEKVLNSAKAMASSGLIDHGWSYINIDDAWQAPKRGGPFNAIQGNEKFPDMKDLCDRIHALGLRVGIYSTPWVTSYAGYIGGSADTEEGAWSPPEDRRVRLHGKYAFADNDAKQWAAWGMDYLKYDWNPRQSAPRETVEDFRAHIDTMSTALRKSGRDVVFSYSNSMPIEWIPNVSDLLNCWRTTGDIQDQWWSVVNIWSSQNRWAKFGRPGHWNDPDMLVVGYVDVGRGRNLHPSRLTPDEQYTHITLWSLLASPLLIGCDMTRFDEFTLNLLCNDEVLEVNQDALGEQAILVSETGAPVVVRRPGRDQQREVIPLQVWARKLEDGSRAVGLFNLRDEPGKVAVKWSELGVAGRQTVRDLWRQKDLGRFDGEFSLSVAPHGAELVRIKSP
jgi:alpha-galactosidase